MAWPTPYVELASRKRKKPPRRGAGSKCSVWLINKYCVGRAWAGSSREPARKTKIAMPGEIEWRVKCGGQPEIYLVHPDLEGSEARKRHLRGLHSATDSTDTACDRKAIPVLAPGVT